MCEVAATNFVQFSHGSHTKFAIVKKVKVLINREREREREVLGCRKAKATLLHSNSIDFRV